MCSDYKAIRILKSLLRHRDKWTLSCDLSNEFAEIGKKAESIASQSLSKITLISLWRRYNSWIKTKPQIRDCDDYFCAFLEQVAFDIALSKLTSLDKVIFGDIGYFNFKFK
jgi:hypothetical protein